jgi:hypothetical protein
VTGKQQKRWTLDPKLDVVFKLLFGSERNKPLLISLLTAILDPPAAIVEVEVLNPEVTKESVETKGSVLDVLVRLADGCQVNIEMQATPYGWLMTRGLYYCTRVYSGQLQRGEEYSELKPVVGIFILGFSALQAEQYHSKFELLEARTGERLTDHLSLSVRTNREGRVRRFFEGRWRLERVVIIIEIERADGTAHGGAVEAQQVSQLARSADKEMGREQGRRDLATGIEEQAF